MSDAESEGGEGQSFISHLVELRERLLKAIAAVLLILVGLLPFANRLYHLVAEPLLERLPKGSTMVAIEVASPFLTPVKLAFFVALFLAMPVVLYQAWRFVAPGLYRNEKRLALPLLASSVLMFYLGCAFAYFVVLPKVFGFLLLGHECIIASHAKERLQVLRQAVELVNMIGRGIAGITEQEKFSLAYFAELLRLHGPPAQHRASL